MPLAVLQSRRSFQAQTGHQETDCVYLPVLFWYHSSFNVTLFFDKHLVKTISLHLPPKPWLFVRHIPAFCVCKQQADKFL